MRRAYGDSRKPGRRYAWLLIRGRTHGSVAFSIHPAGERNERSGERGDGEYGACTS